MFGFGLGVSPIISGFFVAWPIVFLLGCFSCCGLVAVFVSFHGDFVLGCVDIVVNVLCGLVYIVLFVSLNFIAAFVCLLLVCFLIVNLMLLLAFRRAQKISRKEGIKTYAKENIRKQTTTNYFDWSFTMHSVVKHCTARLVSKKPHVSARRFCF